MIVESQTGNYLTGIYRGIVLKHLPAGKCKVFIPGVYSQDFYNDPDSLPTAQQKTAIFAGTNEGNGLFTYPNLSSIVWCQFLNGDVNYPVYESVTLGGEDAFGQYELIKRKDEPVSERHMITSGKTHMLWYEKGLLSGIVEDPIRTQCSVDYDRFELENNNTSADNKYSYTLSNELQEKVDRNEISNINCQYVFNNDAAVHGELSVSTHWYDIVDNNISDEMYQAKGQISTDSYFKMNNDGLTKFETLSTYSVNEANGKEKTAKTTYSQTHNLQKFNVDNSYQNKIDQKKLTVATAGGAVSTISSCTFCDEFRGNNSNYGISSQSELTSLFVDAQNKLTINSIKKTINKDEAFSRGGRNTESLVKSTDVSADQNAGSFFSKILNLNAVQLNDAAKGMSKMTFLSTLNLNTVKSPTTLTKTSQLTNTIESNSDGKMKLMVKHDFTMMSESLQQFIKCTDSVEHSIAGKHTHVLTYNKGQGASSPTDLIIDNSLKMTEDLASEAYTELQMTGKKIAGSAPYLDGLYMTSIDASNCKSVKLFTDNIVNNEHRETLDVKVGTHEIYIIGKNTGTSCTITMKTDGTFELKTTTSVTVKTPTVLVDAADILMKGSAAITMQSPAITMQSAAITLDGPTLVTNVLTVDKDTITNDVSFNGHIHSNGNMGSPTGPRIK